MRPSPRSDDSMEQGATDLPLHREAVETNHPDDSFTTAAAILFNNMFDPVVIRFRGVVALLGLLWPQPAGGGGGGIAAVVPREECVSMTQSTLSLIITGLLGLASMKSQGNAFPFQTHPKTVMLIVHSFLIYGFASIAEHFISATQLGPHSVYALIARVEAQSTYNMEIDTATTTTEMTTWLCPLLF